MNQRLLCLLARCCYCITLGAVLSSAAAAHEFWIEPVSYRVSAGEKLEAHLRNGEKFVGSSQPYVKNNTIRFEMFSGGDATPVEPRMGDKPALNVTANTPGLSVVVHEKKTTTLRYATWEKFQRFADHKAFDNIKQRHQARGLPDSGFKEVYSRHSKSLIAVNEGKGNDRQVNLAVELVALNNPYTDDLADGLKVVAYYLGNRQPHTQIELFEKDSDGKVVISLHKTDDMGEVLLPVRSSHSYLVDMVVLREPSAELVRQYKVVWETLWASLTFAVP